MLVPRTSSLPTSTPSTGFDVPEVDLEVDIDVSQKLKLGDVTNSLYDQDPYFLDKRSANEKAKQQMEWKYLARVDVASYLIMIYSCVHIMVNNKLYFLIFL